MGIFSGQFDFLSCCWGFGNVDSVGLMDRSDLYMEMPKTGAFIPGGELGQTAGRRQRSGVGVFGAFSGRNEVWRA